MPSLPFYQIDAFASRPFEGNQACVMPLDGFLNDETLQAIAAENNVAETAFIVPVGDGVWQLRWFTPATEAPLCGHATLAAAHVLYAHSGYNGDMVAFDTRQSGRLSVTRRSGGRLEMDFPASPITQASVTDALADALGARPIEVWTGGYTAALFETAEQVIDLAPNLSALEGLATGDWEPGCVGCAAPGGPDGADATSRFFAPGVGLSEDPATGSWHCMLAPLMAAKLGRSALDCFQAYPGRGARIGVEHRGERVGLIGEAVTMIEGRFHL